MVSSEECCSCTNREVLYLLLKLSKPLYMSGRTKSLSLKFFLLKTTTKLLLRGTKVYFITLIAFFCPVCWLLCKEEKSKVFFLKHSQGQTTCGNSFIIKRQKGCNTTLPRRAQAPPHVGSSHMFQHISADKTSEVWTEPIRYQGQAATSRDWDYTPSELFAAHVQRGTVKFSLGGEKHVHLNRHTWKSHLGIQHYHLPILLIFPFFSSATVTVTQGS